MRLLKILIADDEPLKRSELRFLLEQQVDVEIVGEVEWASEALEFVNQNIVDVVFLDILFEGEQQTGLDLARNLNQRANPPSIVFVTAHPQYALEGYSNYPLPLHFINTPIDETLVAEAIQRARKEINPGRLEIKHKETMPDGEHIYPIAYVKPSEIVYVQKAALTNTLTVHLADNSQLEGYHKTLAKFKDSIGNQPFLCPHLSFLVNPDYVSGLKPRQPGDELYFLLLKDRSENIPVSRSKLSEVKKFLESC
ncbi:MAG: LytTR family DNA-binding domain-containing protein [Methylococcaceae bacterium]